MAPQSRGSNIPTGFQSKSTPNLPTIRSLEASSSAERPPVPQLPSNTTPATAPAPPLSPQILTSPSEPASIGDDEFDADLQTFETHFSLDPSTSSDEDDTDAVPPINNNGRPLYSHLSRSHSHIHIPSSFAPPFYNRPPTPLPPSPSLTSLLRPSFSAQTSRPTTPDSSDVEGGANTATSSTAAGLNKSAANASPVPRASPKVPTYEYYGFVLYLASSVAFLIYLLWSYLPSPFLHQLGIYYYPNRWWSLAVPAWLVMALGYIYVALASYNTKYLTLPMNSIENLVDEAAQVAIVDARGRIVRRDRRHARDAKGISKQAWPNGTGVIGKGGGTGVHSRHVSEHKYFTGPGDLKWRTLWNEGTDAVMDVPIGGVCEILYGQE